MWNSNHLVKQLRIEYPIIQGPMSGANTPELTAAVANAGGLGSLGAAQLAPEEIRAVIQKIRALTEKPFAINLFVPDNHPQPDEKAIAAMNEILDLVRKELGIAQAPAFAPKQIDFREQLEVLIQEKVPAFSFTFGVLPPEIIAKVKAHSIMVFGTATTVREAVTLAASGVDGVIAQGYEAGGHRGTARDTPIAGALIGAMALVPQVVNAVRVPVIAAGGIMDGRGIVASLALGASAAQMGTAFLTCPESGISAPYRQALLNSTDESTQVTPFYTGRYARGIYNHFMERLTDHEAALLAYPYQRYLTQDIVSAAKAQNKTDFMMMWSGQAAHLCREMPAAALIKELVKEVERVLSDVKGG